VTPQIPWREFGEKFWRPLVQSALKIEPTPFYIFALEPIRAGLAELDALSRSFSVPVRHWLSCKTQPLRPLLRWWQHQGRGIEVVSEFELQAALREGFAPERILVNGPAKHHWLPRHACAGLSVNFDSMAELKALLPFAQKRRWRVGVRLLTGEEFDPENPEHPTQFGLAPSEALQAIRILQKARLQFDMVHFHLRTNVADASIYDRALREAASICRHARFQPRIVDCGGGWPPRQTFSREGEEFCAQFELPELASLLQRRLKDFPGVEEIWFENGRFLSARSGVLVVRILDVKERRGLRQCICDGGRTLHALVSHWERHRVFAVPARSGPRVATKLCGPTCMAFDQLGCHSLPRALREGDALVWMETGAYHIPWETRFSHGQAAVFWHDETRLRKVRARELFPTWWRQWR
jgi:diaminopimelate decarboxylase